MRILSEKTNITNNRMKDMIYEALESGGGIKHAKGHDLELIVTTHDFERPSWECHLISYVSGGN
jgi:hypothetical protein